MRARVLCFLSACILGALPLLAAVDMFIKFDGVEGESKKPGHTGQIEIESFSFGVSQAGAHATGGGGGAGKVAFHDISITKRRDTSSPMLMAAAASGRHFQTVTIDAGPQQYVLQDVVISSIQQQHLGDGSAHEVLKLSYAREGHEFGTPNTVRPVGAAAPASTKLLPLNQPQPRGATFSGGVTGGASLQSLKLNGQRQAIIVVCDVAGGGVLAALQRSGRQTMPRLLIQTNSATFNFTNASVSSFNPVAGGCAQVSLNFSNYDGPPGGM